MNSRLLQTQTPVRPLMTLSLLLLLTVVSCDSTNPVAPAGSLLSITANPARIAADGSSEIRVFAQKPNGTPVNPGTVIRFSTTLGTIPSQAQTDSGGEAAVVLNGGGEFGTSTVTATAGSAEQVSIEVQIGFSATSISIQATPSSVAETGGQLELLAIVRDDRGLPLRGASVNFRTETGNLESGGQLLTTDETGEVRDTLEVTAIDLDTVQGDTFQVQVEVASGTGALVSTSATINIQRLPKADFTFGTDNLTVVFTDTSTGRPSKWVWDFGDGNISQLQNPTHTYSAAGTYTVTLSVSNNLGSGSTAKFVSVSGQ